MNIRDYNVKLHTIMDISNFEYPSESVALKTSYSCVC